MTRYRQIVLGLPAILWLAAGCSRQEQAATTPQSSPPPATNTIPATSQAHMAEYYGAPFQAQKKIEFFGEIPGAPPLNAEVPFKNFKLISYRTNGSVEMTLTAPECLGTVNGTRNEARSAGPFHAQSGDGSFTTDGTGFHWLQDETNSILAISNNVVTTIQETLLAARAFPDSTATNAPTRSNLFLHVYSDRFNLDRNTGTAVYSGNVRAEDDQFEVHAQTIHLHRGASGNIDSLIADKDVLVIDKADGSRAMGDQAVYTADASGAQRVTLTGNPRWQSGDGLSEGTAKTFVYDRASKTFEAVDSAHFRVASTGNSEAGFFLTAQPAGTNASGHAQRLVDVDADHITLNLSSTKGPPQKMAADGHVVIVDETGGSRTTADHATYVPADGSADLLGHAQFQSGERLVAAGWLSLNRTAQTVFARTNALVRFPPAALGGSGTFRGLGSGRAGLSTNGIVGIASDSFDLKDSVLTFHDHVRAAYSEGNATLGTADCGQLSVTFYSNTVTRVVAEQGVHLHQPPSVTASGKISEGDLVTQRIDIRMRTNGIADTVDATGGVKASQTQAAANGGKTNRFGLTAETLHAKFLATTNDVESASASGGVRITDNELTAQADRLDYTASNETAVLTGNPFLARPGALSSGETAIIYDRLHNTVRVRGRPQSVATVPVTGSKSPAFLSPLPKSPGKTNP